MSESDFPRRTLIGRFLALAGIAAIVGVAMAGLWAAGVFDTAEGAPAELVDTPSVDGVTDIGPKKDELAPDFEVSDFDGKRHRLSDFRGKVVYLNFWATWCVPCRAELPDIYRLHKEYGDDLIVIEMNKGESEDVAKDYFDGLERLDGKTGVTFTVNGIDPTSVVTDAYARIGGLPVSIIIDRRGVVSRLNIGQLSYDDMKAAVEEASGR